MNMPDPRAVVLLVPGMLNTPNVWDDVRAHLREHAEVRVLDVRMQTGVGDMARDAWSLVADVPAQTPLVVCGFSMGGYVAIEMAARPVRPLHAMALLSTSGRPESPQGALMREKTITALGTDFGKVVQDISVYATHPDSHANGPLMDYVRREMESTGAAAGIRQNRAILARADHRFALERLRMPVMVMCGRADKVTPPVLSEELAALIPGASLAWIEGAGHMSPLEQPEQVAALLQALLPSPAR